MASPAKNLFSFEFFLKHLAMMQFCAVVPHLGVYVLQLKIYFLLAI